MKNIALAIQMYLADNNDVLPPFEHRAEVLDFWDQCPGGASDWSGGAELGHCIVGLKHGNPYIRWPVVLDEYIKNRDVWRCPSAKVESGARVIIYDPDYFRAWSSRVGSWGDDFDDTPNPCMYSWPNGWGGEVTDSFGQERIAIGSWTGGDAAKAFVQSIATNATTCSDMKMVEVQDAVKFVVIGDGGVKTDGFGLGTIAWPDICLVECANSVCDWVSWEMCTWATDCGLYDYAPNDGSFLSNSEYRKPYSRHLGGVNLGFLDGHASWIHSDRLVQQVKDEEIFGVWNWGPYTGCVGSSQSPIPGEVFTDVYPDVPVLY